MKVKNIWLVMLVVLLLLGVVFSGHGSARLSLVGTTWTASWECVDEGMLFAELTFPTASVFEQISGAVDGDFVWSSTGTYTISGNSVTLIYDDDRSRRHVVRVSGNTLTFDGITFTKR